MKTDNNYTFESKPKNLKQWLHKHDTLVLIILIAAIISILYLP